MRWTIEQYNDYLNSKPINQTVTKCHDVKNPDIVNVKNANKYRAKITKVGDITFRSKHEAEGYKLLRMYEKTSQIQYFVRQPILQLTETISWRPDFLVVKNDFTAVILEYKGVKTKDFKLKLKLLRENYSHINLEIIKTGQMWKP